MLRCHPLQWTWPLVGLVNRFYSRLIECVFTSITVLATSQSYSLLRWETHESPLVAIGDTDTHTRPTNPRVDHMLAGRDVEVLGNAATTVAQLAGVGRGGAHRSATTWPAASTTSPSCSPSWWTEAAGGGAGVTSWNLTSYIKLYTDSRRYCY